MKKNMKIMAVLAVAGVAAAANAQTSILYLTDRAGSSIQAYQDGVQLWDKPQQYGVESPIAVANGTIRTIGERPGEDGGQYNLNGNYIGPSYTNPFDPIRRSFDSTSDGTRNYTLQYNPSGSGDVYATDTVFGSPVWLFAPDDVHNVGITYDPTGNGGTGSLWISGGFADMITEYTLNGDPLFSFGHGIVGVTGALALDHADGTLWMVQTDSQTAYQFNRNGALLSSFHDPNMGFNAMGGEFMIPAPGSLALLGLGGLLAARRRRT